MISSAEEFKALRESEVPEECNRAAHDEAASGVWEEVLKRYPDLAFWVVQNKTVPIAMLDVLASHRDPNVRCMVARKRKLPGTVMERLAEDPDESVKLAIARNPKVPRYILERLSSDPWQEVRKVAHEKLAL